MLTRGRCLYTYSIPAIPLSRPTRNCSQSYSCQHQKCQPICAVTPAIRRPFFRRRQRHTESFTCAIPRCSTTRKTFGRSPATCSASLDRSEEHTSELQSLTNLV